MLSIRECIVGRYALYPAHKYDSVGGDEMGRVGFALGRVSWGGILYAPHTNMIELVRW